MRTHTLISVLAFTLLSCGEKAPPEAATPATPEMPSDPVSASIESALDRSTDACDDFYQFACGGWIDANEIPSDQVSWGRSFHEIAKTNQETLRSLLEANPDTREGQFYASCMDEESIEAAGAAPLAPMLAEIDAITDKKGFASIVGSFSLKQVSLLFDGYAMPDFVDPEKMVLHFAQGGLGLPDREYYLSDDKGLVEAYEAHVVATLVLAGVDAEQAAAAAPKIIAFETKLAEASRPRAEVWDPDKSHHPMTRAELAKLSGGFDMEAMFAGEGHDLKDLNIMTPEFFEAMGSIVAATELETLKAYSKFHTVHSVTPFLSKPFVDQRFGFYGAMLSGQKEQRPRWKRCVAQTDNAVGELLGKAYVESAFAGESKTVALEMIQAIETAFEAGLAELEWMDDATREKAAEKARLVTNKIGYPDNWKTYEGVTFKAGDHFGNAMITQQWAVDHLATKVGGPVDKTEWFMTPPTVNAYYNPSANEIVFPAGILQAPFFDAGFPRALNFGAIGMVVGHELTHGFDDDGRKFDGVGRMHEWWAPEVAARFEERAACVTEQYGKYEAVPGTPLNGELTLGENIADLGGIKQTYRAYKAWADANGPEEGKAGFTPDQLVFIGFAQGWCSEATPEYSAMLAAVDSHSPGRYRVNGSLVNTPEFGEAFGCEVGSPMRPPEDEICEVW